MHNIKTNFDKILVVIKIFYVMKLMRKVIIYGVVQGLGFLM